MLPSAGSCRVASTRTPRNAPSAFHAARNVEEEGGSLTIIGTSPWSTRAAAWDEVILRRIQGHRQPLQIHLIAAWPKARVPLILIKCKSGTLGPLLDPAKILQRADPACKLLYPGWTKSRRWSSFDK